MTPRRSSQIRFFHSFTTTPATSAEPSYVLLHGVGLSHRSFSRLARELARFGAVAAPDFPGFGLGARHRRPAQTLTVEEQADSLIPFLRKTRTERPGSPVILVGHSMGVQFALDAALRRPDLVDGLVFVGPVVDPRRPTLGGQGLRLLRDFVFEPLLTSVMAFRDYLHCGTRWYVAEARQMLAYPTLTRVAGYCGPLLVLRGEHDPVAPDEWSARVARRVHGATVGDIPGGRHNVVHSHPQLTADRIAEFALTLQAGPAT